MPSTDQAALSHVDACHRTVLIRRFEGCCLELGAAGAVEGSVHACDGREPSTWVRWSPPEGADIRHAQCISRE